MSEAAAAKAPAPMVDIARRNLAAMRDRLTLVDDGAEVVPGIRIIATAGHTPGHVALSITSDGEQMLHISDVVLYPLHLEHPDWVPVFDIMPEEAAASKHRIFDRAAQERTLVFAHHFPPFPNLGHVRKHGAGWQWQPIQSAHRFRARLQRSGGERVVQPAKGYGLYFYARCSRWYGTLVTTVPGRKRSAALIRKAVWLCRICSHQWRAMNSGSTTVRVSSGRCRSISSR